jgi:hypothetical protein
MEHGSRDADPEALKAHGANVVVHGLSNIAVGESGTVQLRSPSTPSMSTLPMTCSASQANRGPLTRSRFRLKSETRRLAPSETVQIALAETARHLGK